MFGGNIHTGRTCVAIWLGVTVLCMPNLFATGSMENSSSEIEWSPLFLDLFAGLALFLYGLEVLSDGLKTIAGNRLKNLLEHFTSNRIKAAFTGGLTTALVQSSSTTTVLTVGFVSAGLMGLTQSVGVIMGANIGSTVTAQIIASDIAQGALALIAMGFALIFISRKKRLRHYGKATLGLGLLFYGMELMSSAMMPLRSFQPFIELMSMVEIPLYGILLGALFTAMVQSSSATTGIVIVLASQGVLSLSAGIALIFGANIGTCVTAWLAGSGKNYQAKQVACVHFLFNVTGVAIWYTFIPQLASWVDADLSTSIFAADTLPRQVANAHTIFNISSALLLLPFAHLIAALAEKMIPQPEIKPNLLGKFLNPDALELPSVAIVNARLETARMGEKVHTLMLNFPSDQNPNASILAFEQTHQEISDLYEEIHTYLSEIHRSETSEQVSQDFQNVMVALGILESITQLLAKDLHKLERRKENVRVNMSEGANKLFFTLHEATAKRLSGTVSAFLHEDSSKATEMLQHSNDLDATYAQINQYQEARFPRATRHTFHTFRLEMRLLDRLRHIHSLCDLILQSTAQR